MIDKFDDLAKSMAGPSTRRQLLKKFSVGLAATALASFGLGNRAKADQGGNGCKPSGANCQHDFHCCSGFCQQSFSKYGGSNKGTCL
jgi:hypothetical protein